MTEHISPSRMKRFCVRALSVGELTSIAEHLAACSSCQEEFTQALRSRRGSASLKITLAPEFQLRHEHVNYEQLVRLADRTSEASEREMLDLHLRVCGSCEEDVRSFLAFREQLDKDTEQSVAPERTLDELGWLPWLRGLVWSPAYVSAAVILGIALVIGGVLLLNRRAANLEAKHSQPPDVNVATPTPIPEQRFVNVQPTTAPLPSEQLAKPATSPALTVTNRESMTTPQSAGVVAVLNDGPRTVTINTAADVSGLEDMPMETRREIADILIAESIELPEIATELSPANSTLRGPTAGLSFKLLSPGRMVIVTDHPLFEWEKLPRASAYRVLVGDMRGHEVARSEHLSPNSTSWTPPKPLKRGETYAWTVIAIIDGTEVSSPGPSASAMKFKVLSAGSVQELERLKVAGSHLALGIFYVREGMLVEAEREFQILVDSNPRSPVLKKLLKQIQ